MVRQISFKTGCLCVFVALTCRLCAFVSLQRPAASVGFPLFTLSAPHVSRGCVWSVTSFSTLTPTAKDTRGLLLHRLKHQGEEEKKRSFKPNKVQVHFFIRLQCGQTIRAVVRERELLTSLNLSCSRSVEVVGEKFCKWTKMLKHLISSYFKYVNLSEKLIFNAQHVSHHMLSCFRFYYRLVCVSFFALLPVLSFILTLVSLSNLLNNCHFLLFSWVQEISRYKFRLKT